MISNDRGDVGMSRSVVITGGFGALGHVVAERFAVAGDKVTRMDLSYQAPFPIEAALDLGGVDLTDPSATRAALTRAAGAHGGIDVLINIAGGFSWEPLETDNLATWAAMLAANLMTAANVTQLALPELKAAAHGRILNIGAAAALKAGAGMGPYAASKAGVHRLTEALSEELAGTAITVNAILPTIIDTPANRETMPDADFSLWVTPAAVADVIIFLASPAARAISGALIPVSRGTGT
jgi:NAD(P)-dependent dehydrogenase (short-subunit alcohol dehydrogenase family)